MNPENRNLSKEKDTKEKEKDAENDPKQKNAVILKISSQATNKKNWI